MTPQEVLDQALQSGVFLYLQDEQLKFRARSGALSPELRSELARHRESIVQHLRRIQAVSAATEAPGTDFDLPPLGKRAAGDEVPLSYAQQRLWFIDRLEGGSRQYFAQSAHRLTGRLDVEALRRTLTTIVERHEALRTVITEDNGTPCQVIRPPVEVELPRTDLSALSDEEQEAEVQRLIAAQAKLPCDLGRDLMFRAHLLDLGRDRHVVLFGLHHIAADAWSLGLLQGELIRLYPAYCQNLPNPLPPLALQYADYTVWQRGWLRGEPLARQLDFWRRELEGIPEVHGLPLDYERPAVPSHAGGAARCRIGSDMLDGIRALCKRYDVTLFMFLHTAVSVLLARYSGRDDVVMGTPVAGRVHPDLESMIGLFVNTVVLRTKLDGNPRFTDLLARNRQSLLDALTHQHVPFEMVVEELKPRRTTSYSPLFQVLFNMQPAGPRRFALPGLTFENVSGGGQRSKFELVFNVIESPHELSIKFGYSAELFHPSTIERMAANFLVLLESILAAPEEHVRDLELLGAAERERLQARPVAIVDAEGRLLPEGAVGRIRQSVILSPVEGEGPPAGTRGPRLTAGESLAVSAAHDDTGPALGRWTSEGDLRRIEVRPETPAAAAPREERVEPRTETEQRMARVWSAVLKGQTVGVADNFFGAGGHSLSMIVLIKRIAKEFDVDIPLATFIGNPTIEATARFVDETLNGAKEQPAIPALSEEERLRPLPLSFAQTRIWFITRLEEGRSSYNIPAPLRFTGTISRETLRRSFETIVARHAILRTVYREENHQPVQVILPPAPFELPLIDLSAMSPEAQERRVGEVLREEALRPFDLTREPSLRVLLLKLAEENHILLFNVHHIAADGWSIGVLTRELNAIYGAYREGRPHSLPELPVQYCDYAVWQRDWLAGPQLDEHLGFWRQYLSGIPKVHGLPLDRPRPAYQTYRGAHYSTKIDAAVARGLDELGRAHNATLFMVLQAALAVLVHRYSGEDDVVVGAPVANRLQSEVEPLVGCFVNTLVLRSSLAGNPRFTDFVAATNENLLQAFAHQSVPFELLVEDLNPERDLSHAPLFQIMFAFQNNEKEALDLPDLKFKRVRSEYPISKFDLTLYASQSPDGLALTWEYATDLFNRSTIETMASGFATLLESIVRAPEERVGALRLLSVDAEQQLLRQSAGIPADERVAFCIHELFEARARELPDAIAVKSGSEELTYAELNGAADRLARHLRRRGVRTGALVGLCVERSLETIVGMLGILKAGGAYLPLDASYPPERLRYMVADSGVELVLVSRATRDELPLDPASLILLDDLFRGREGTPASPPAEQGASSLPSGRRDAAWPAAGTAALPGTPASSPAEQGASSLPGGRRDATCSVAGTAAVPGPESLAYVIYTSGSTGQPKGVAVEHRGVTRLVCDPDYVDLGPDTVTLQACAMTFDVSTFEIWAPLLNGGTVAMLQGDNGDVAGLARQVGEYGVNTLWLTSGLLPLWAGRHTPALGIRQLLAGGDVVPPKFVDEIHARDPRVQVINGYGPTENTTFSCCYRVPRGPRSTATVPIGLPIRGSSAYVLDRWMQLQPVGCPGELWVGGTGVARGYIGKPELTGERFVPNPFSSDPDDRLYRTGDVARWLPDGTLEFLGRNDHQVKIRGFRVELGEIEDHLSRVPGVSECAVVASDARGTGKALVAYLVAGPDAGADLKERCRLQLRESLPEYMVPGTYVVLDRMPLSPSRKIDRRALPAPSDSDLRKAAFAEPRTDTERTVTNMWRELLRVARVGIDDNFFELGGHSLLAARFISSAREAFGIEIPMRVLFEKPTVREFATWFDIYNAVAVGDGAAAEGEELFL